MKIKIKTNERVFVCGKTGSGKSVLVKNLILPQIDNFVLYDHKNEVEYPGAVYFHALEDFRRQPNQKEIIYRPEENASDEVFNNLCGIVYRRGKNVLVLDEVADHVTSSRISRYHDIIMRLGRSKGVGIINCTQRPIGVHNNIISQCEHFFIFSLPNEGDRKKLAGICGSKIMDKLPEDYWFYYYHLSMDEPILCKPVTIKNY